MALPAEMFWSWMRPLWTKLPRLTQLTFLQPHPNHQERQRHSLTVTDIECMVDGVPKLRVLHMPQIYLATTSALQPLLRLKTLTHLSIQACFVMPSHVLQMPTVSSSAATAAKPQPKDTSGIPVTRPYSFIQDLPALTSLTAVLHRSSLTSLTNLFSFRQPLRTLTHLVLFVMPILDMGFFAALRAAAPSLTHLDLHYVSRSRHYTRPQINTLQALRALRTTSSVRSLRLFAEQWTETAVEKYVAKLRHVLRDVAIDINSTGSALPANPEEYMIY